MYENYNFETKILSASIRTAEHVRSCSQIGSDIATIPYKIFQKLYYNPLTENGIEQFEKDWKSYNNHK